MPSSVIEPSEWSPPVRACLWVLAGALLSITPAFGAEIVVTNSGDTPVPGTTTLREAVAASGPNDTIAFAVDQPIILTEGEIIIDHDLILQGPSLGTQTILRNPNANPVPTPFRFFTITQGVVSFSHLTLSGGSAEKADINQVSPPEERRGGAIMNAGTLTLANCFFLGNSVNGDFGGPDGEPGADGKGGAIYNSGTLTVDSCSFDGNIAVGGAGGGLFGGMIPGGHAGLSAGGALYNAGTASVINSTFAGNASLGAGGGPGSANEANGKGGIAEGGAVFNDGSLEIRNSTFSQNGASGGNAGQSGPPSDTDGGDAFGGAIYTSNDPAATTTIVSTLVARSVNLGGWTSSFSRALTGGANVFGSVTSSGFNLVQDASDSHGWISSDQVGTSANPIDPLLQTYSQNNGGPVETYSLRPGSPAIDRGNGVGVTTDERGLARAYDDPAVPNAAGGDGSDVGAFELQPAPRSNLQNVSTRARVENGEFVLIGGLILTGQETKTTVFRAIGLDIDSQPNSFVDPVLELHGPNGDLIATNDNWEDSQASAISLANLAPYRPTDAAILTGVVPDIYTAIVRLPYVASGTALVEAYDIDPYSDSSLDNLSARGDVGPRDDAMIAGFILGAGGGGSTKIAIRGLGPSVGFAAAGLQDPTLELYDSDGALIGSNDDWRMSQETEISAVGLAPSDDREPALIISLSPGAYTAVLRGKNETSGIALVEVYRLE